MRLLFLTPYLPSPPSSGGSTRIHGLISNLALRCDVAILAFKSRAEDDRDSVQETGRYARLVVTVENPSFGISESAKRLGQLRSLVSCRSYESLTYRSMRFQRAFDRICNEWRPDAIIVEFAQMGYLDFPLDTPVLLDAHNVEHEIIQRTAKIEGSALRRIYSAINARKLRREETALAIRVDGVAVTSDRDRRIFEQLGDGVHPVVIPNGVDCTYFQPRPASVAQANILFFGALDYYPNTDAILNFHREIWSQLSETHPQLVWNIVGRLPPPAVEALASDDRIHVPGLVPDIRDRLGRSSIVIVPLRAGSGTRLKVLEAMAMGKPVVSTSLGVEGLDVVDGEHLLVADDPDTFARSVSTLLESAEKREKMGRAARRLVETSYDWREISATFERMIESVIARRQEE